MIFVFIKLVFFSLLIVFISKNILVIYIRKLANSLNLSSKKTGQLAGFSTSVPEILTITTSGIRGLMGASIYNILSSNIINLIQYLGTIFFSKNIKKLKNNVIKFDMILVLITIIIPILLIINNIPQNLVIVPLFLIFYVLFIFLNNHIYKQYFNIKNKTNSKIIINKIEVVKNIIILLITSIFLYVIGELLGNTLEILCNIYNFKQSFLGIFLGFITSIPELMTFFESQKYNNSSKNEMLGVIEATNNLVTSNCLNLFIIQTISILLISL